MTFDDRCILTDGCGEKVVDGGPPALAGVCFAAMMLGLSALSAIVSLGAQAQAASLRQEQLLGYSVLHRPITATEYGAGPEVTLVLGGMEGDEPAGSYVVQRLEAYLDEHDSLEASVTAVLVPQVNPDGLARDTRVNARGVDINRNFPTADWRSRAAVPRFNPGPQPASEPETRIVIQLISQLHPCQIITIHAPFHQLNIDGPAMALARAMQQFDHYRITTYIGYQTLGSLGTYAGKERHIPVVTLELPPVSGAVAWAQNRQALLAGIDFPCRQ